MNEDGSINSRASFLGRTLKLVKRVEDGILVALLTLMIGVAALQILLRNLFGVGFIWGDALIRILVLWIGLFGAMIATRQNRHISIDLVARYLPGQINAIVKATVQLFAAAICALAAYYSFIFVQVEFYDGGLAFGRVPVWVCEAVMPLAFAVMAVRYVMMSLMKFYAVPPQNAGE